MFQEVYFQLIQILERGLFKKQTHWYELCYPSKTSKKGTEVISRIRNFYKVLVLDKNFLA